jgi:TetR/AcrR family transcriptional repressor of nem operon
MSNSTYEAILSAARALFVEKGYTAASMRELAERVNIGKATIYHHFPDKRALILVLLDRDLAGTDEALAAMRAENDPRRRMKITAENAIKFLSNSMDILQIVRRELPDGREQFASRFSVFFRGALELLTEAVKTGTARGMFRAIDPVSAARVFMMMVQGAFVSRYLIGDKTKLNMEMTDSMLDVFFSGIDARK